MISHEPRSGRGFTLIELLVYLAILWIPLLAIGRFFVFHQESLWREDHVQAAQQRARIAVDQMVNELRMAGYSPTRTATQFGLTNWTASEIRFTLDYNGDGTFDAGDPLEDRGFRHVGMNIERYTGANGYELLADNVESCTFRYYDHNGSQVLPGGSVQYIRTIRVDLTVRTAVSDPDLPGDGYLRRSLQASVQPRNFD
jgi:type II secretory pathway component PulJ